MRVPRGTFRALYVDGMLLYGDKVFLASAL